MRSDGAAQLGTQPHDEGHRRLSAAKLAALGVCLRRQTPTVPEGA
jgi:hypothetical protein